MQQYSSARTPKNKVPEVTPATIIQRTKNLFTPDVLEASPFASQLYKVVRNKVKKLDDIVRIEERVKEYKGDLSKITEEQAEKLKNKESYMQSVQQTLEAFEIYKNSELVTLLAQKNQKSAEEVAITAPAAKPLEETKEMLVGAGCETSKPISTQT